MARLLDAADMVGGKTDDKSVVVYVAKLRQAFSDQVRSGGYRVQPYSRGKSRAFA